MYVRRSACGVTFGNGATRGVRGARSPAPRWVRARDARCSPCSGPGRSPSERRRRRWRPAGTRRPRHQFCHDVKAQIDLAVARIGLRVLDHQALVVDVDVAPAQPAHLRDPQPGLRHRGDHRTPADLVPSVGVSVHVAGDLQQILQIVGFELPAHRLGGLSRRRFPRAGFDTRRPRSTSLSRTWVRVTRVLLMLSLPSGIRRQDGSAQRRVMSTTRPQQNGRSPRHMGGVRVTTRSRASPEQSNGE